MLVKVCPKCAEDNEPGRRMCRQCGAAIDEIPLTVTTKEEKPPEPLQLKVVRKPLPKPLKIAIGAIVVVLLFYIFVLRQPPKPKVPADQVTLSFLQAKTTRNYANVEPYLSAESAEIIRDKMGDRREMSQGSSKSEVTDTLVFGRPPSVEELVSGKVEASVVEAKDLPRNDALVRVTISMEIPGVETHPNQYYFVLTNERRQWKIDLAESRKREDGGGGVPSQ